MAFTTEFLTTRGRFHQLFTYSFYARGSQKRKKDSQVVSLLTLSRSTSVKAERKYVGEIEPRPYYTMTGMDKVRPTGRMWPSNLFLRPATDLYVISKNINFH